MNNLIIELPESYNDNELYQIISNTILTRINNKSLKFIPKYSKSWSLLKEGPYNRIRLKEYGIQKMLTLRYLNESNNIVFKNIFFIIKNNTVILDPSFFVTPLEIIKRNDNMITINYKLVKLISCVNNLNFNNQLSLIGPNGSDLISINHKEIFKLYFFEFMCLILYNEFNICGSFYIDIIMPKQYDQKINFINTYLKMNKINETAFKNNNSSNSLFYYNQKINYYD